MKEFLLTNFTIFKKDESLNKVFVFEGLRKSQVWKRLDLWEGFLFE
jgi:hypothetical protein